MFDEDGAHSQLLWALEMLGWRSHHLPEVCEALAKLATYDRTLPVLPGKMSNRPFASLANLLDPVVAQTDAGWPKRREVLRGLRRAHPELSFDLLLGFVPQPLGGLLMQASRPAIITWKLPTMDDLLDRAQVEGVGAILECLDDLLEMAGIDATRWERLIGPVRHARLEIQLPVLTVLEKRSSQFDSDVRVWGALRGWLHVRAERNQPVEEDAVHPRVRRLYDALSPEVPCSFTVGSSPVGDDAPASTKCNLQRPLSVAPPPPPRRGSHRRHPEGLDGAREE